MVEPDESPDMQPICQPRLVRFLRQRPKLINVEVRDKFLEYLEEGMCERRKPGNMAQVLSRTAEDVTEPVVRETARDRLTKANERLLRRL